jgi:hypothetical protein
MDELQEVRIGLPASIREAAESAAAAADLSLSAWLTETAAKRLKLPVPARRKRGYPAGRPRKPTASDSSPPPP